MPGGSLVFGFMSFPGACAADLRKEVGNVKLQQQPDAVCVMAPSNNLTTSINPEQAGQEFEQYLSTVAVSCSKVSIGVLSLEVIDVHIHFFKNVVPSFQVFCIGMVPRLTESRGKQELFQQEYHRRSAKLGRYSVNLQNNSDLSISSVICLSLVKRTFCIMTLCIVSVFLGIPFFSTAEYFPLERLHLWARDGVRNQLM